MGDFQASVTLRTIWLVLLSFNLLQQPIVVTGGSVLFYMPVVSRSIRITFMPVATEMARRGHEVFVVTQHPDKNPNPNMTEITIDGKIFNSLTEKISVEMMKEGGKTDPPLMEFVDAQIAVSISIKQSITYPKGMNITNIF